MIQPIHLDSLDDHSILLVMSRLGLELRGSLSEEQAEAVQDETDSRRLIGAVAKKFAGELNQNEPITDLPKNINAGAAARQLLGVLSLDSTLRPRLEALVSNPPRESRPPTDPAGAAPVIMNTVAAWLQTRVKIEIADGDFQVDLDQRKVDRMVIEAVTKAALELWMKQG